jgi:thiaminase
MDGFVFTISDLFLVEDFVSGLRIDQFEGQKFTFFLLQEVIFIMVKKL